MIKGIKIGAFTTMPQRHAAAIYLRSATCDPTVLAKQKAAIEQHAVQNGIKIVKTFVETDASYTSQKEMLWVCLSKKSNFTMILMEDTTRWGRPYDPADISQREVLCKQSGIDIRYVREKMTAPPPFLSFSYISKSFIQRAAHVFK